jgi:hypothetical protein
MFPITGGPSATLRFQGTTVAPGAFGGWTPIGAEAVAGGFEVAWKNGVADQYTAWKTDASGNYQSSLLGVVAGADAGLVALETLFQQDLNGDGKTGPAAASPAPAALDLLAAYAASVVIDPAPQVVVPCQPQPADLDVLATPKTA